MGLEIQVCVKPDLLRSTPQRRCCCTKKNLHSSYPPDRTDSVWFWQNRSCFSCPITLISSLDLFFFFFFFFTMSATGISLKENNTYHTSLLGMWERWHNHLHRGEFKKDVSHPAQLAFRWRIHPKALNASGNRRSGSARWSCGGRWRWGVNTVGVCVCVCGCFACHVFRKVVPLAAIAWSEAWRDAPAPRFLLCSRAHVWEAESKRLRLVSSSVSY